MMIYTGIGSRKTPPLYCHFMMLLGKYLASKRWILRSGGASGADIAFEMGCNQHSEGRKEIYLPWKYFNKSQSALFQIPDEAFEIAKKLHSHWDKCSSGDKKLLARDVQQVLGKDLTEPSKLIICWTPEGKLVGGTSMALKIANEYAIPIINLANYDISNETIGSLLKDEILEHEKY